MTSLLFQLDSLLIEPILLDSDSRREAQNNTSRLSKDLLCDSPKLAETIQTRLVEIANNWLKRAELHYSSFGRATFYAWYDELAGHLCVSITSSTPDKLPFSCHVIVLDSPEKIIQHLLWDGSPGVIPWGDLSEVDLTDVGNTDVESQSQSERKSLEVWAVTSVW